MSEGGLAHLDEDYAVAWSDWDSCGKREAWEAVDGDGLIDAAR